ncbi:MAG: phosphotransferase, partial [Propionibacteriaceae bacterium]
AGDPAGDQDLTWSVTRRLSGSTLLDAWPSLDTEQRRDAGREVATILKALHSWRPSSALIPLLIPDPPRAGSGASGILGRSMIPLPLRYARELLDLLCDDLGPSLSARLRDYLDGVPPLLVPSIDVPELGVIHGDLHLSNLWCDGGTVTALLDLEWIRLAPPYVELARLKDNVDADELEGLTEHRVIYDLLRQDYPELFAVDDLDERIRLVQVLCELRQLAAWEPAPEGAPLAPDHPLHNLTRLLGHRPLTG